MPTFEEVVALVNGRLDFDVEIKSRDCEAAVLDVLARHPNTKAAISSFEWDVLANVRALDPEMELWVLTHFVTDETISAGRRVGATTLALEYFAISETSMEQARNAGFEVMAWTVNDPALVGPLLDAGVTNLISDDPARMRQRLDEILALDTVERILLRTAHGISR